MHQYVLRNRTSARIGLILSIALLVGFVAPKHAEATTSAERYMASLINRSRHAAGRASLSVNDHLSSYARKHSATMAAKNKLYHNPDLASWLRNWNWRILGENVGYGPSIPTLHTAFMRSTSHRRNILDRRFRNVGVGVVVKNGRTWVTVIFRG
jgi:uncharacterized protein YkwD